MANERTAALTLVYMKSQKLDAKAALALNNLIKSMKEITNSNESRDYKPPAIPPVPSLRGLIDKRVCSKPFEKLLTKTDLTPEQSRLLLKKRDVQKCLIKMLNEDENLKDGIPVTTYDMEGKSYNMTFKLWSGKSYVLTSGWTAFLQKHKLTAEEDLVTIRMFRHAKTHKLCFVIGSRKSTQLPQRMKTRRLRINRELAH